MVTLLLLAISCQVPQDPPPVAQEPAAQLLPSDAPVVEGRGAPADYSGLTKEQLEQERVRLLAARPPRGMAIGMMGAGGGGLVFAATMFIGFIAESLVGACFSILGSCYSPIGPNPRVQNAFLGSSIAGLVLGVTGLVVGGVLLKLRNNERAPYSDAVEVIDAQLEELENPKPKPKRKKSRAPQFVPAPL